VQVEALEGRANASVFSRASAALSLLQALESAVSSGSNNATDANAKQVTEDDEESRDLACLGRQAQEKNTSMRRYLTERAAAREAASKTEIWQSQVHEGVQRTAPAKMKQGECLSDEAVVIQVKEKKIVQRSAPAPMKQKPVIPLPDKQKNLVKEIKSEQDEFLSEFLSQDEEAAVIQVKEKKIAQRSAPARMKQEPVSDHRAHKVEVTLCAARNLPHVDGWLGKCDAFVEFVYKDKTQKSSVKKNSLDPDWKPEEKFEFDLSSGELADIEIQLKDWNLTSSSKLLGTTTIGVDALKRLMAGDTAAFPSDEFLITAPITAPDGKPLVGKDNQQTHLEMLLAHLGPEDAQAWDDAVLFTLTLDVDFKSIGDSEAFKRDVVLDVATAAKIDSKHVKVTALRAGSVIVDMLIAKEAGDTLKIVQDLEEQVHSPNSLLMQGKLTSRTFFAYTKKGPGVSKKGPAEDKGRMVDSEAKPISEEKKPSLSYSEVDEKEGVRCYIMLHTSSHTNNNRLSGCVRLPFWPARTRRVLTLATH
jgi:hypothetical protein